MQLSENEVHIWSTPLAGAYPLEESAYQLLSPNERERADRLRFDQHKRRFTIARANLRRILSLYTGIDPENIQFTYNKFGKPNLNHTSIEFNLAHSEEIAIYAIRLDHPVGVDIEKVCIPHPEGIAGRFFSPTENLLLSKLPEHEQCEAFYRIWARKEAIIKGVGGGLSIPLSSFDVSLKDTLDTIKLDTVLWYLLPLSIHPAFQAAVASNHPIQQIKYWHFSDHDYKLDSISQF